MANVINIQQTFGAMYIGSTVAVMLYGITTLQTYLYYAYYPNDSASTKWLVACVWVLETVQTAFVVHAIYLYLVEDYMQPSGLARETWSLLASVALNVFIAFVVQSFFTKRIYTLSSRTTRMWLVPITALVVLAHLGFGMTTVVTLFQHDRFAEVPQLSLVGIAPFAIFAVVSDVLIAGALCVLLHRGRSGSMFRSTNTLVNTLIIYAINRCLLTSTAAIAETVTYAVAGDDLWFLGIDFVVGKLYANSLLATLNTRNALRAHGAGVNVDLELSTDPRDIRFAHATDSNTTPHTSRRSPSKLSLGLGGRDGRAHTLTKETFQLGRASNSLSGSIGGVSNVLKSGGADAHASEIQRMGSDDSVLPIGNALA